MFFSFESGLLTWLRGGLVCLAQILFYWPYLPHNNTAVLVSTLVATWVSGSFFGNILIETYKTGLYYFIPVLFEVVCFFIVGYFFIPRMSEFLGKLSIAEAMNDIYGQKVRIVTSISGFIFVSGLIAVQLKNSR